MLIQYDPESSMRQARDHYFAVNGFGADGGYADDWVDFKFGPIPFPFPNTEGRKRALAYHDLHHIVTGYGTDLRGEFEISAWELGAGCGSFYAAWYLNFGGLMGGVLGAPRRTFEAFVRGRSGRSLYGRDVDALLDSKVSTLREELGAAAPARRATAADVALFVGAAITGAITGGLFMAVGLVLAPLALVAGLARKAAPATAAS